MKAVSQRLNEQNCKIKKNKGLFLNFNQLNTLLTKTSIFVHCFVMLALLHHVVVQKNEPTSHVSQRPA